MCIYILLYTAFRLEMILERQQATASQDSCRSGGEVPKASRGAAKLETDVD